MRGNIIQKSGKDIRHGYIQQYLKLFLCRVHPDLFQNYPKEQLRNSTSLQDLLPIVGNEKTQRSTDTRLSSPSNAAISKPTTLFFYVKPKDVSSVSSDASISPSQTTDVKDHLKLVVHTLPVLAIHISSHESKGITKEKALEQEIKSWEMVQSFLELCRKVGVAVRDPDELDVAQHLQQNIDDATARSNQQQTPHKPLSEVFVEELQSSFSGSVGGAKGEGFGEDVNQTQLGKTGGLAPALSAELMIKSNPLLFKSPSLSSTRLSKVIRTWIHWQEEESQRASSLGDSSIQSGAASFRLGNWWRKVPVMILSSGKERAEILQSASEAVDIKGSEADGQSVKGMLVVDQEMSKEERIQLEYQEVLRAASPPTRLSFAQTKKHVHNSSPSASASLSPEAASYLERMRARTMLDNVRSRSRGGSRGGSGVGRIRGE
ncbi:hypothetical protein BGZ58_008019 [Dissophora ornata]|nr:hypothetical protein BGZ58_008019 [Dissophora ornata]